MVNELLARADEPGSTPYDLRGNYILSLSKPKTTTYSLNSGAPNENIVENHLNIALLSVF